MKRKFLVILLALVCAVCCAVMFAACSGCNSSENNNSDINQQGGSGDTEQTDSNGGTISGGDENCEHKWSSWSTVSEATCTEKGKQERSCSVCGGKETKEIPALGHSFNTNNTCTRCGFELIPTVGLEYKEFTRNDETYEMVTGIGTATDTDLVIPAYHAGKAVRKINDNAFNGKDALKTLYIANGVQEIGEKAFAYCTSLTKIELPESLAEDVYELVRVPDVGYLAHRRVYIPNLGVQAFYGCTKLSEIIMPEKGLRIASNVFDSTAYYNNANNWDNNVLFVQNHLIVANSNFDSEIYNLNANVVSIADKAFDGKSCLKEFNVPYSNSLQRMADNALSNNSIVNAEMPYAFLSYLPAQNIKKLKVNCSKTIYNLQQFVNVEELNVNGDWVDTSYWSSDEVPPLQGMGKLKKLTIKWIGGKGHRQYTLGELFGETEYSGSVAIKQRTGTDSWNQPVYDTLYVPSNLNEVTVLSGGITSYAFHEMSSISKINLGSDVNSVGDNICYHCNEQVVVNFANETEFLSTTKTTSSYVVSDSWLNYKYTKLTIDNKDIVDFKIPNGTTNIKECAFINCAELKSVTIPSSVTSIGKYAFRYCESLESVYITDLKAWCNIKFGDKEFGSYYANPLTYAHNLYLNTKPVTEITADMLQGVTEIKDYAFAGFGGTIITISDYVTSIGEDAFYGCTNLGSVNFGDNSSLTSIGNDAFYDCSNLTSITIPDGVTSIGERAFSGCEVLTTANIPNTVTVIGVGAFSGCNSSLFEVVDDIKYIDMWAVGYVNEPINVDLKNETIGLINSFMSGCSSIVSVTLNNVKYIGQNAFNSCGNLQTFTLHGTELSVGNSALKNCVNMQSIYIDDLSVWCGLDFPDADSNPLSNGANLYIDRDLLTELVVPENVKQIGSYVFYGYRALKSIIITPQVESIGRYAFGNCVNVDKLYFNAQDCYAGNDYAKYSEGDTVFYNLGRETQGINLIIGNKVKQIPGAMFYAGTTYQPSTSGLSYSPNVVSIVFEENSVCENISSCAFACCNNLESVVLPDSLVEIGSDAFIGCVKLKNVTFPDNIESIYSDAFKGCSSLEYTFKEGIYYMGNNNNPYLVAFKADKNSTLTDFTMLIDCKFYLFNLSRYFTKLQNLYYPGTVTDWATLSFPGAWSENTPIGKIKNVYISNTLVENLTQLDLSSFSGKLRPYAFAKWTWLENCILPNNLNNIPIGLFYGCTSLKKISFPNTIAHIGDYAFYQCESIQEITLPEGLQNIGWSAFEDCHGLKTILMPKSINLLEDWSFARCENIQNIYYLGTPEEWNNIDIGRVDYSSFYSAQRYYFSLTKPNLNNDGEDENGDKYWHYSEEGEIVVWMN